MDGQTSFTSRIKRIVTISFIVAVFLFILPFDKMLVTANPVDVQISDSYYFNPVTHNVFYSPMGNFFEGSYEQLLGVNKNNIKILGNEIAVSGTKIFFKNRTIPTGSIIVDWENLRNLGDHSLFYSDGKHVVFMDPEKMINHESIPPLEQMGMYQVGDNYVPIDSIRRVGTPIVEISGIDASSAQVIPEDKNIARSSWGWIQDKSRIYLVDYSSVQKKHLIHSIESRSQRLEQVGFAYFDGGQIIYFGYDSNGSLLLNSIPVKNVNSIKTGNGPYPSVFFDSKELRYNEKTGAQIITN